MLENSLTLAKHMINKKVNKGDSVVDATVGNGNDTLLLAKLVGREGKVYGFDIQEAAIENTTKKLKDAKILDRVNLYNDSHENINKYIKEKVSLIIFNLGYLPGDNKHIITRAETTIPALKTSFKLLNTSGFLIIVSYYGHKGGKKEKNAVESLLKILNQKQYNILKMDFINRINCSPILYCVEKI